MTSRLIQVKRKIQYSLYFPKSPSATSPNPNYAEFVWGTPK